jgi:hypothetical protein
MHSTVSKFSRISRLLLGVWEPAVEVWEAVYGRLAVPALLEGECLREFAATEMPKGRGVSNQQHDDSPVPKTLARSTKEKTAPGPKNGRDRHTAGTGGNEF